MSRIDAAFARLRQEAGKALVAYLTVGFPSPSLLPDLVMAMADSGVDILELGIPFSDPLADGPTIQAACAKALGQGVTPRLVLKAVEGLRRGKTTLPIALLTYYNPVHRYGVQSFCRHSLDSGVDGLIIPDLPPEEGEELVFAARPLGINTIFLAAPTSPPARMAKIAKISTGFIYYVSLTGVTGARDTLPPQVGAQVRRLKAISRIPVCVGFGISRPQQVREVVKVADGAIVGSALLEVIGRARSNPGKAAAEFIARLRRACDL